MYFYLYLCIFIDIFVYFVLIFSSFARKKGRVIALADSVIETILFRMKTITAKSLSSQTTTQLKETLNISSANFRCKQEFQSDEPPEIFAKVSNQIILFNSSLGPQLHTCYRMDAIKR